MNDVEQMRERIKTLYPNTRWRTRVNKMPDRQVQAIFLRAKRDGRL